MVAARTLLHAVATAWTLDRVAKDTHEVQHARVRVTSTGHLRRYSLTPGAHLAARGRAVIFVPAPKALEAKQRLQQR